MADALSGKHTPGPWIEPCNFGATRFEVQGDGRQVAVVNTPADARLIAAAPDLLAALNAFLQIWGPSFDASIDANGVSGWGAGEGDAISNARAAIARATGAPTPGNGGTQ